MSTAIDGTGASPTPIVDDRGFFGHPRGLSTLFFTEMWERFSFYGMRAILLLFMTASVATGGLGWDTAKAGPIYGLYTALVYLTALPGGWIADRLIGQRRSVLIGGRWGFGAAAGGMTLGLVQHVLGGGKLGTTGLAPSTDAATRARDRRNFLIGGVVIALLAVVLWLQPFSVTTVMSYALPLIPI